MLTTSEKLGDFLLFKLTPIIGIPVADARQYLDAAAAEIAEAHAADKADALAGQDATWHEIEDEHLARIAGLEVRLAEMRSLLSDADDLLGQMFLGEPEILQLHENIHKVLSAPHREVLWRDIGMFMHDQQVEVIILGGPEGGEG